MIVEDSRIASISTGIGEESDSEKLETLVGYLSELEEVENKISLLQADIRMYKADAKEIKIKINDFKEGKTNGNGAICQHEDRLSSDSSEEERD